jgi:hypothetical protein
MSHVCEIDLHITDLAALSRAAIALGMDLKVGQSTYRWYGRHVGDYPLPAGFKASELGKCEHALTIPGNGHAYEVGIVRRKDRKPGYTLLWDFYAGGYGLQAKIGEDAVHLRDRYAAEVSAAEMRKKGFMANIIKTETGVKVVCKK